MKIRRLKLESGMRIAVQHEQENFLLPRHITLSGLLVESDLGRVILRASREPISVSSDAVHPCVEDQEIWACGVTYFNSKMARVDESGTNASIYEQVYAASRPQVFPKGRGRNVISSGEALLLRPDSKWTVPEPELVLAISKTGDIVGVTCGNDLSCRDIEGTNPLYQPQAKIWKSSCALSHTLHVTKDLDFIRSRTISMKIRRKGKEVFSGETSSSQIVRPLEELASTLCRFRDFEDGVFLFTGTGIIPPESFSLEQGDEVSIAIDGVAELTNRVERFPGSHVSVASVSKHGEALDELSDP